MSSGTRTFYFCTFLFQGSSFLNPRAYAIMHRMHHAYSDTEKDPHSPHFIKDVWGLMIKTKNIYLDYRKFKLEPEPEFRDRYPTWGTDSTHLLPMPGEPGCFSFAFLYCFLHRFCALLVALFAAAYTFPDGPYPRRHR